MRRNMLDKMNRKTQIKFMKGFIIIFIILFVLIIFTNVFMNLNDHKYTITVTDKERVYIGDKEDGESKYLIYGDNKDGESLVFENVDSFVRMKWNSSNMQGSLHEGKTYTITVVGYRIPFMSMYENIIKVEEVKNESKANTK